MFTGILLSAAVAMGPGAGPCMLDNPMMRQKLELTDEQSEKLDDLMFQHHLRMIDLRATLEKKQLALEKAMSQDDFDAKAIKKAAAEVSGAQKALLDEKVSFHIAVMKLLTPEQRKKMKSMKGMMMGPGHGMMMGKPGGMMMMQEKEEEETD